MPIKTHKGSLPATSRLAFLWIAMALALTACRPVAEPLSSAPPVTPTRVVAPVVNPDPAADWQRIQATGRIVVGTSANFPPFDYYDQSFRFVGYDPALLEAIGRRLGLEVVFKDFALEVLTDALAMGQIDVAAAALTVTPERMAVVDFTQPYFATSEGFLTGPEANTDSITNLADLAGLRIGVEQGSIYASWLQRALLDDGLSAPPELIQYTSIETAAQDLAAGRIDLLVTDLPATQQLARRHNLSLAGQGLLAEQYALAVRQGADEWREQLNTALAALAADGTLARLAQEQLELEPAQLLPLGQLPSAEAAGDSLAAESACVNGLAWLEDLSLLDQGMTTPAVLAPGQPFTKSWRVLNTGTCTWGIGYQLVFAHGSAPGASMGGQSASVSAAVAPGDTAVLTATLVAPITPGVYQGSWQLQDENGRAFGERLRVGIQVAGVPTPTPAPTQTPVAGLTFTADAERVLQGSPVTISWDVTGADEVYFYTAGQSGWSSHEVAAQGEASVIPSVTTTYQLRVIRDGQVEDRLLTVYVEPNPALPQVTQFTLSPSGEMLLGQCVLITWRVEGDVEQTALFRNKEPLWDDAPVEGALEDCPPAEGEYEYAVGAQGQGGRNYAVATLRVAAAAPEGAPAAKPAGPSIARFSVQPDSLTVGGCVELQWDVSGEAATIQVLRDDTVLLDGAPAAGSGSDCPTEPGLRRYQLSAADTQGQTTVSAANVWVMVPASTPMPPAVSPTAEPLAPAAPGQEMPAGYEFLLISYRNAAGDLVSPLPGTQVTLSFGADGSLGGSGGCNRYTNAYQLDETALTIAPGAATEMFCAEPIGLMDQEAQYIALLPATAAYQMELGQLTLLDGAGNPLAIYVMVQ